MRLFGTARFRWGYLLVTLTVLLAGDAWRHAFGWWSFGVLVVASGAASVLLLIANRDRWRIGGLPYPLLAFLAFATTSLAWSFYPGATALGLFTTWLIVVAGLAVAVSFSWVELLRGLAAVLGLVLALSLLFELIVALVIRAPVLPVFAPPGVDYADYEKIPLMLLWSRNELFEVFDGGRIQGVLGNANNLGALALLALVVFAVLLADRRIRRRWGVSWLVVAAIVLVMTRSATITLALAALAAAALAVLLVRRARSTRARWVTASALVVALAAAVAGALVLRTPLLEALGRSPDLTGRFEIWAKVIALAQQRPAVGWGWVSYWVPWAPPFDDLAFRNAVRQLQAHNAWLDLWLQVGVVGLVLFGALVVSALVRSWSSAVDSPLARPYGPGRFTAEAMLPLLVLVALLVQSLAESRLLVEYGLFLVVVIAVKTKSGERLTAVPPGVSP